ncbi:MAG: DEAD/DEAH box helicase family protein, partial [Alphaproteobacteria bacterium]|nr:DEAD/DEAH box helicase family protein [Alphaproteobacteria bacterium]
MSASKKTRRPAPKTKPAPDTSFSIDEFIGEIEKAEDIEASRRLPQERLRNQRRLDREAAEKAAPPKTEFDKRRTTKTSHPDTVTGMSPRSPKSKANSVERPANLDGFGEAPQAGFTSGPASASSPGVTATVAALQNLIEHGRKEVEGAPAWVPHRPERPAKMEGGIRFRLDTEFEPAGDQPQAIADLVEGVNNGETDQVLLGVTGSGKTFTIAQVIARTQRPALILAPNKTLAAQLYGEFKSFFPENSVEYFVSYYDYYQPEAYVPRTDTYIEKESTINEQIDRMRHSATRALLERDDAIIVASVSCIYGIGSVETYTAMILDFKVGQKIDQRGLLADLVALQYKRADAGFARGAFRVRGDTVEIFPAHYDSVAWRITLFGDQIENISEVDPLTGKRGGDLKQIRVYANSHYVTPRPTLNQAMKSIKTELAARLRELTDTGRFLEAQRL